MRHNTLSNIGEFHASESSVVGDGGGARRKEGGLLHKKRGGGEGDRRRIKSLNHARSILGQFLRLLEKEGEKGKRARTHSTYSFLRIKSLLQTLSAQTLKVGNHSRMNPPLPPRVIFSSLFKPRLDIFPVFGKIVAVVVVACERFLVYSCAYETYDHRV